MLYVSLLLFFPVECTPAAPRPSHVWVRCNDGAVDRVSEAEVLDAEAYMLYYLRGDLSDEELKCDGLDVWYPLR